MFPEVKVKTLSNFADHLGLAGEAGAVVEDVLFAEYWDNPEKRDDLQQFRLRQRP